MWEDQPAADGMFLKRKGAKGAKKRKGDQPAADELFLRREGARDAKKRKGDQPAADGGCLKNNIIGEKQHDLVRVFTGL